MTAWRHCREDLYIRNESAATTHEIRVAILDDGRVRHEKTYRLAPGQDGCSVNLLPAGRYTITVTLDGGPSSTATVRVGDTPERTIVAEVADERVTITEGHE
ncbi:hypothetical protein ACFQL1_23160 [Halomicroarcula sp. GCM10025709]|uniref:hypothetical protein n=1 Tax=Haloarcula TaxID=2237 RepID=UPI0024C40622|nr:hypothetical protein [Halomicroarcula sp. YJ-61-S]